MASDVKVPVKVSVRMDGTVTVYMTQTEATALAHLWHVEQKEIDDVDTIPGWTWDTVLNDMNNVEVNDITFPSTNEGTLPLPLPRT